jgi:hypothetical protein
VGIGCIRSSIIESSLVDARRAASPSARLRHSLAVGSGPLKVGCDGRLQAAFLALLADGARLH